MNSDFRDLLKLFNAHRVRYLVVGGYAVRKTSSLTSELWGGLKTLSTSAAD